MADITMCLDKDCPTSSHCYRFTAPPCPYRQSYFCGSPREPNAEFCDYVWIRDPPFREGQEVPEVRGVGATTKVAEGD